MQQSKYYHEMTEQEINFLSTVGVSMEWVADNYLLPDWCSYGKDAIRTMSCTALVSGYVKEKGHCEGCVYNESCKGTDTD